MHDVVLFEMAPLHRDVYGSNTAPGHMQSSDGHRTLKSDRILLLVSRPFFWPYIQL